MLLNLCYDKGSDFVWVRGRCIILFMLVSVWSNTIAYGGKKNQHSYNVTEIRTEPSQCCMWSCWDGERWKLYQFEHPLTDLWFEAFVLVFIFCTDFFIIQRCINYKCCAIPWDICFATGGCFCHMARWSSKKGDYSQSSQLDQRVRHD